VQSRASVFGREKVIGQALNSMIDGFIGRGMVEHPATELEPMPVPETAEPKKERKARRPSLPAGRRSVASASRDEVIGGVLLLVVVAWAVQALFADANNAQAFPDHAAGDFRTLALTAALVIPFAVFFYGGNVHAVTAGTAIGYIAYAALPQYYWWHDDASDHRFPAKPVVMAVLLAAAWFMFRRGSPVARGWVEHRPSRYLQIGAALATLGATLLYINKLDDYDSLVRMHAAILAVALFATVLSFRRSLGATIVLATLAAETTFTCVTAAIDDDGTFRDRLQMIALAAAVLTGTTLWRTRRAVRVDAQDGV